MAVINFKYVDPKYLSTIVKNKDTGRQFLQVQCPSCKTVFDKRDFFDHVCKTHGKRRDEVLAQLFGIKEFPVICTDCGKEVHFDEHSGIFSRKCSHCLENENTIGVKSSDEMSLDKLLEQQKNLEEVFAAKKKAIEEKIAIAKKENEWKSIDINDIDKIPDIEPGAAKYFRKVSYLLRTYVTNGGDDKQKAYNLLNMLDKHLEGCWEVADDKLTEQP